MALTYEYWLKNRTVDNHRTEVLRHTQGVGIAASTIKGSPEWKVLCDHWQAMIAAYEEKADRLRRELTDGPIVPQDDFYEKKRQLAIATASMATGKAFINLVDALINEGETASIQLMAKQRDLQDSGQ